MKSSNVILLFTLLLIIVIIVGIIVARFSKIVARGCLKHSSRWIKRTLESIKNFLFTASVLTTLKHYRKLEALGLIKRINHQEIITICIGVTLILFA